MWRGYTKIKLCKSIVCREVPPERITFIYKGKAVATVLPLMGILYFGLRTGDLRESCHILQTWF